MKKIILIISLMFVQYVNADDLKTYTLNVKDGKFQPEVVQIAANEKFKLEVKNLGATPEEFESTELNREKVVGAGKTMILFLGPLTTGEYQFIGDFHPDTAHGKIVVK